MPSFTENFDVCFIEITAEKFDDMLNVLPPIFWSGGAFMVSEPNDHRECRVSGQFRPTYNGYWHLGDKYYAADTDLTVPEFKAITAHDMRVAIARAGRQAVLKTGGVS